MGHKVLETLLV